MSDIQPQNLSSLAVGHDAPATSRLIVPTIDLLAVASTIITRKKRKKNLPNTSKIELFNGENFKHWQKKVFDVLDVHDLANYLHSSPLEEGIEDNGKKLQN